MDILYILHTFPKLSETFILNEITELIDLGHNIGIISLNKPKEEKIHDKVKEYNLIKKTKYIEFNSIEKYSRLDIFEKGSKELFESKILTKEEKFKLLDLCYNKQKENAFRKFLNCLDIIKIVKEKKIKHIHCHFALENVEIAYIINQVMRIPYTFTTHAFDIFKYPSKDIKKWADRAKKVITISNYNKKYMVDKFGIDGDKIEVVHCGIELNKFKSIKVKKEKKFTILTVGRLHPIKGQKYLVESCKILKDKGVDFQCWIIGEGSERRNLEKQIRDLNLEKYVKLLGAKKNEELLQYYNKADVFVLPSISESMGLVNIEALACKTPVIASDVRGVSELVRDNFNGFLVKPEKPKQIAEKIIKLKDNKELMNKFKKNARKIVEEEFDVRKNVKKLLERF